MKNLLRLSCRTGTVWMLAAVAITLGSIWQVNGIAAAQAENTMVLSPSGVAVDVGESFSVDILFNAGSQQVNGVEAYLDFDPNVLQVTSLVGGDLPLNEQNSGFDNQQGQVDFLGLLLSGSATGTIQVATVTFEAVGLSSGTLVTFGTVFPRKTDAVNTSAQLLSPTTMPATYIVQGALTPTPTATMVPPTPTPTATPNGEVSGKLETVVTNVSGNWSTINLTQSFASPVAVCSTLYANTNVPYVVRMRNINSSSFDLRLQNPGDLQTAPTQTVSCLVAEEGAWTMPDGRRMEASLYQSTVTDNKQSWVGEARPYQQSYARPVVLGQVMSSNDADWSTFWSRGGSRTVAPSDSVLYTGKHVGEDPDTARATETVGYIVFEAGSGQLDGVPYEVELGSDSVVGIDQASKYTFAQPFSDTPAVAITTQAGMDGTDGSWSVLFGLGGLRADEIDVATNEDQLTDSERFHTTEQVGYAVFAEQIAIDFVNGSTGGPQTVYAADTFERSIVDGWASADTGGPYTLFWRSDVNEKFDVNGGSGTILAEFNSNQEAVLDDVRAQDVDYSIRLKANKASISRQDVILEARRQNAGNMYRVRIRLLPNGVVQLQGDKAVNGTWSAFPRTTLSTIELVPNEYLNFRVQFAGDGSTTIRVKVWADGTEEPADWIYSATDSTPQLQAQGGVGIRVRVDSSNSNAPILFSFDDLRVTSIDPAESPIVAASTQDTPTVPMQSEGSVVYMPVVTASTE